MSHGEHNGLRLRLQRLAYRLLDTCYLPADRPFIRKTRNLRRIPCVADRRGGKYSYAEWAHVIGIFQTLLDLHLPRRGGNRILDVGCGTGLVGIASEPYVGSGGEYHGIDVSARDIAFCRRHYPDPPYRFTHLQAHNPVYAPQEQKAQVPWPLEDRSMDAVTALSVWTHLDESDARYYAREIQRVLQPTGIALITLFLLDSDYEQSVIQRTDRPGRFHGVPQSLWNFDRSLHGAEHWRTPSWAEPPETAVGITAEGLEQVLQESGLTLIAQHPGNWKEVPGLFFQDVLVLKPAGR